MSSFLRRWAGRLAPWLLVGFFACTTGGGFPH
jgi:hypothetical protein